MIILNRKRTKMWKWRTLRWSNRHEWEWGRRGGHPSGNARRRRDLVSLVWIKISLIKEMDCTSRNRSIYWCWDASLAEVSSEMTKIHATWKSVCKSQNREKWWRMTYWNCIWRSRAKVKENEKGRNFYLFKITKAGSNWVRKASWKMTRLKP